MLDMSEQDFGKFTSQISNTKHVLRHSWIDRVCTKVELLLFNSLFDRNSINDVLLRSVLDSNKSKSQGHIFTFNHPLSTCSLVHDIDLSDDTDCSYSFIINFSSHLKTIRVGYISICRNYTQYDGTRIRHVSICHSTCNLLDIIWLIRSSHGNSCNTWKIDQSKIWASLRVNCQNNRFIDNVFTLTTNLIC